MAECPRNLGKCNNFVFCKRSKHGAETSGYLLVLSGFFPGVICIFYLI